MNTKAQLYDEAVLLTDLDQDMDPRRIRDADGFLLAQYEDLEDDLTLE